MEIRKQLEAEFHDKLRIGNYEQRWSPEGEDRLANDPMWSNFKYYCIERKSLDLYRQWMMKHCPGKRVLDFACGNGEESFYAASIGAKEVVGIDISPIAVANCRMRAHESEDGRRTRFEVADGEALPFPDNYYDVAMEYGALHHVDLNKAVAQLARVLRPNGKMICTEALAHNPAIHLYRRLTPDLRTQWEYKHILRKRDFAVMRKYFGRIDIKFFHLATLAAVPLRRSPGFTTLLAALERIDSILLSLPAVKWLAWQMVFVLSEPRKLGVTTDTQDSTQPASKVQC